MKKLKPTALMKVPLSVNFEIGRSEKELGEVLTFKKGNIIKLENSKQSVIQIYVNGSAYAEGIVLSKDGEMYVKITNLLNQ